MGLPDLERVQAVMRRAGDLKTNFEEKNGWVKIRALVADVKPGFLVQRHSSTCSGRVLDNLCVVCNVPALNRINDFFGFVVLKDWHDPSFTFEVPFASAGGAGLFGMAPNIAGLKTRADLQKVAGALVMQPFKVVIKVKWDAARNEVGYLAMNFKPITTEGATYASSASLAAFLGVADTL